MKNILALSIAFLAMVPLARGAVIYSGVQNLGVPQSPDGLYLNVYSGATAGAQPGSWNTAPWLNPFFGGVYIATDDLFLPVITGADQIVNLAAGTMIDVSSTFATAESGSTTHVGGGPLQFQLATPGYMGFAFRQTVAGPGVLRMAAVDHQQCKCRYHQRLGLRKRCGRRHRDRSARTRSRSFTLLRDVHHLVPSEKASLSRGVVTGHVISADQPVHCSSSKRSGFSSALRPER